MAEHPSKGSHVSAADIDAVLTSQIVVAWAGESGEDNRLGWWRSAPVSEVGGIDQIRRSPLVSWPWAALQAVRETARRHDADLRRRERDADLIISLFHFGVETDKRIEQRIQDLKRSGQQPEDALPLDLIEAGWNRERFFTWVEDGSKVEYATTSIGRRIQGAVPASIRTQVDLLVSALAPAADKYPLPYFRLDP